MYVALGLVYYPIAVKSITPLLHRNFHRTLTQAAQTHVRRKGCKKKFTCHRLRVPLCWTCRRDFV